MLPSARRRQQETAAREAAGESVWTTEFDHKALTRLSEAMGVLEARYQYSSPTVHELIGEILRRDGGWSIRGPFRAENLPNQQGSNDLIQDIIGATYLAAVHAGGRGIAEAFAQRVNDVLREHRVAYKFVEGELIPFESDELLQEVVEPTLRLLVGDKFKDAHASYLDALKEISHGKPDDAITDAGRALQQALEAMGCEGDVLSKLIADAKEKNLFRTHDQQLHEAFILIAKWAASERNKVGDAHTDGGATIADAWFIVHVVGALIVRLADPSPRGSTA